MCVKESRPAAPPSEIYLFAQGLWIVVMNPKAVIFFAAFLPQFYVPEHGLLPQFLAMAGTFVGIEVVVESRACRICQQARCIHDERHGHAHVQPCDRRCVRAGGGVPADARASSLKAFP